jgi:MFS-type transporter involved in bile tolerance (Atg22 family)
MIQHIKTFVYGFTATLFCWSCIIVGGFSLWLAFALGIDEVASSPFWIIGLFIGVALGGAGLHGFWEFLKEEELI